jgi:hypothetical protein
MEDLIRQLRDLLTHIRVIKDSGTMILDKVQQIFIRSHYEIPTQLETDITECEGNNDIEGIIAAIEDFINRMEKAIKRKKDLNKQPDTQAKPTRKPYKP